MKIFKTIYKINTPKQKCFLNMIYDRHVILINTLKGFLIEYNKDSNRNIKPIYLQLISKFKRKPTH